jgi:drug/metabolite transporter (DMT)-like permease
MFDTAVALYALEARQVPSDHSLRPSLLGRLVRRPRWLAGTAIDLLGFPLQVLALSLVPLTVVQPTLAVGLLLLLVLGVGVLGEPVGSREILATSAIIAGVTGMAWAAPGHSDHHAGAATLIPVLGVLCICISYPFVVRGAPPAAMVIGAGCAYSFTAITGKLLSDELLAGGLVGALGWLIATGAAAGVGILGEMSALQRRPATVVAPTIFVVQVIVPVALSPLISGESWGSTPLGGAALVCFLAVVVAGAFALMRSPAVAAAITAATEDPDGHGIKPRAVKLP